MKTTELIDKFVLDIRRGMKDIAYNLNELQVLANEEFNDDIVLTSMMGGTIHIQRIVLYIREVQRILQVRDSWKTEQVLSILQDVLSIKHK